jgi:raffinose/stachyose/melibiose transport system permease protein
MRHVFRLAGTRLIIYGILAFVALAALGPATWVVISSFKRANEIYSGRFLPDPWTTRGYGDLVGQVDFAGYALNTFLYASIGTVGATTVALLAAYPCARLVFPFRRTLTAVFSLALAIPLVGLIVPEYFIAQELGIYNTKIGLILFYSALFFPLCFVLLRAYLVNLPYEIEEAARVDGAGYGTILWRIVVPLVRPGMATAMVLVFIGIWNDFLWALLLAPGIENYNIQVGLSQFVSQFQINIAAILAGVTIAMLVPIATFLVMQRHVIEGLTAGSSR